MAATKALKKDVQKDFEAGLTPYDVVKKYEYKNLNSLWVACKRWGIVYPHYGVGVATLTPDQRQIILGTMLGDGTISKKNGRHTQLKISHCFDSIELVYWKFEYLKNWVPPKGIRVYKSKNSRQPSAEFSTYTHPVFSDLRQLFYPEGKKIVPQSVLDELEPLGIAAWFMDDGSHMSKIRGARIHVSAFSEEDNQRIVNWFQTKWEITTHLGKISGGYPIINIYGDNADKFSNLIRPHILPSFKYKID